MIISDCCKVKAIRHCKSNNDGGDGNIHYTCSKCKKRCEFITDEAEKKFREMANNVGFTKKEQDHFVKIFLRDY